MYPKLVAATLVLIVIAGVAVTVSGEWWLTPQAANWHGVDAMLNATTVATGAVFVIINLVLAYTIVRYAARDGHRASSEHHNAKLEWTLIGLTSAAIVTLLAPGLVVYGQIVDAPDEEDDDALVVDVVARQWDWDYRYPGEDGELGTPRNDLFGPGNPVGVDPEDETALQDRWVPGGPLMLPVDRPVKLRLRSQDVIHIYFIPQFRVKQAAMPGMVNELWFEPSEVGEYDAVCTEFCGITHHSMVGPVQVVEDDEFEEWLEERPTVAEAQGWGDEEDEAEQDDDESDDEDEEADDGEVSGA